MNPQHEVLHSRNSSSQTQFYSGADMIDVKEAVQVAKAAANDFLGQETVLQDLMLEEVELNPGDKTWAITLGFNVPAPDKYQRLGASLAGQIMIETYIRQYRRKGIIVDTNLLLLALIGGTPSIAGFKRTSGYTAKDYKLLLNVIDQFEKLISTPHILAEVSNLTNGLYGSKLHDFYATLKKSLSTVIEIHCPALDISCDYELSPYGLTDVGIICAAKDNYLVLTDDLRVAGFAHQHSVDVVNFNHIREASWDV
eukprot:gene14888-18034_t